MKRLFCLLALGVIICNTSCKSKVTEKEETATYKATKPLTVDTFFNKEYISQLQSVRNIEIRAQEKGYLQKIYVDEGQKVKSGQILFSIMPKIYEAELLKAKAEAKSAELEMLNTQKLADKNIVSKSELSIAQAKLEQANAEVSLAELHLSFCEIKAPYDGTIDRIRFKQGSLIDEGSLLTTLSDNSSIYAYFNVSESEYLNFKSSQNEDNNNTVSLLLANNQLHKSPGKIETIESEFDNTTGNIAFRAKFPNPDFLIKNGETGKVQMKISLPHAILIPQKATYELQDNVYVYVIDKNKTIKSRKINVKFSLPDLYVVDSGLSDDEIILLEGIQKVKDDDKIDYEYLVPEKVISSLQLIK